MTVRYVGAKGFSVHRSADGSETVVNENIGDPDVTLSPSELTNISLRMGFTKNLGDFESLRIDVGCVFPCKNAKDDMDKAFELCSTWVDSKLLELQADIAAND